MSVEEFLFGEKGSLGEKAVHNAYAVALVVGGNKGVARVFDGFEVARSYVTAHADDGEIFHFFRSKSNTNLVQIFFVVSIRLALIGCADGVSSKLG
jgi:hypothetical protein